MTMPAVVVCECGCGLPTDIAKKTSTRRLQVKGWPIRYRRGHHPPKPVKRYANRKVDGKTVTLHRLRAEAALGRPLPAGSVVHHVDGSKTPNAPLVICQSQGYHNSLHARLRTKEAGGNPWTDRVCGACGVVKPLEAFGRNAHAALGRSYSCRDCARAERLARNVRVRAPQSLSA